MKGDAGKVLAPSTPASTVVTTFKDSKPLYLSHRMQLQTYDSQNVKRLFT